MSHKHDDDSDWEEVDKINDYALFMGYLSMAIKGMGFLVGLWTTVVLLGGFVSMLGKKDFWSLTIITLVQTAGVFDVFLNEKLRYVGNSFYGLCGAILGMLLTDYSDYGLSGPRLALAYVLLVFQLLVFAIILCPLAALYLFGLLITTGLSLWRLIHRDYGMPDDGGSANLEPALNVLYSLVLFQGVLFCYRFVSRFAGKRLAGLVAVSYGFKKKDDKGKDVVTDEGQAVLMEYMRETKTGCEKDPSFTKGRNLVTYAVALIKPESSSGDYVSGATILDKILEQEELHGQHALIRKLVGSASSSQVLQRLLESLRSTSPLDRDVRVLAARIVAHLAGEISLANFPYGIECISSLLKTNTTDTEQQDRDSATSTHYKELMVLGRVILHKLAADEHNRSVISSAQGLIFKAMVPVTADLLHNHNNNHDAWSDIVAASLQLMFRLVTSPGKTGDKLLSNKGAINTVEKILTCEECNQRLHVLAIKILTQLPMEASSTTSSMGIDTKTKITKLLIHIFTKESKDASTRQLAGEALAMLSDQNVSNATIIFEASDTIVQDLTTILLDIKSKSGYRISAAEILEHLYVCYIKEDGYSKKLTEAMKDVLPKVLKEILVSPSKQGEKQAEKAEKGTDETKFSTPVPPDLETGEGAVASKDNGNVNEQKDDINKKNVDRKLHAALLSLSAAIFKKLITNDRDLAELANTIVPGPGDSASRFAEQLKTMVKGNSEPTANCLVILKITSRMIISLLNLEGSYPRADLESLMESLSEASKEMFELEAFMMFSSSDHNAMKPQSTLGSLVKEAKGLLEKKEQNGATTPASPVNGNQTI